VGATLQAFRNVQEDLQEARTVKWTWQAPPPFVIPDAPAAALLSNGSGEFLFKNQRTLKVEQLKELARELGLDGVAFGSCLDEGKSAAAVGRHHAAGSELGVTGTPAFFVGKSSPDGTIAATAIRGAQPIAAFRQAIDRLLEGQ